jgi:YaiO family outer membrane protein
MRTALIAGLVAGTFLLHAVPGAAAESSLKGLRIPSSAPEAYLAADRLPGSGLNVPPHAGPALAPRASYYDGWSEVRRFTLGDADYRVGLYRPAGRIHSDDRVGALLLPHDPHPRYLLSSQLTRRLPDGWGLGIGVRQAEHSYSSASLIALSTERQWGSLRGGYTVYAHWTEGSSAGSAHRFELSYAYGQRNTIGLSYTTGRDVESTLLPAGAALADVRDLALSGRHWLSPNWALTYDVSQEQSPLFRRQGLRLGVSRTF